jgi:hypothetical protein
MSLMQDHFLFTSHVWGSGILYAATLHSYFLLFDQYLPFECLFLIDPLRDKCFQHLKRSQGFISTTNQSEFGVEVDESNFKNISCISCLGGIYL